MSGRFCAGVTLVELMVAMVIAALLCSMILQTVISFQSRVLKEVSRNDLHGRAERLMRFLASDIRSAAFLVGSVPQVADGTPLRLVHDSLPGDPVQTLPFSILAHDGSAEDDALTIVKAVSFAPPLRLVQPGLVGESELLLNRRPNRSPGSTRELLSAPEAINHLVLDNSQFCYAVASDNQALQLNQPLEKGAPAGTEVLGVRALTYSLDPFSGSKRLRRDDFTSRAILDDAVDGLQFEYLLKDGSLVSLPASAEDVRGVRIHLLVRGLRADRDYRDEKLYLLGEQSYGPFRDGYRRTRLSQMVEVKNHGL